MGWNGRKCVAFGCSSQKISWKKTGISFYSFPKDKMLLRLWLLNIKRLNYQPSHTSSLCSKHFTDDDFIYQPVTNRRGLKKNAVPSLFSYGKGENHRTLPVEQSTDDLPCGKHEDVSPDSSDSEFIDSEFDVNEVEENNSALLDISMNEKFYTPEQLETLTNVNASVCPNSNPKGRDTLEKKHQIKEQLKAKIFLTALKKQWLDAEIKAATARKNYYETKNVMLSKLQSDLGFENSSDFETSTALQNIKVHLKKEELASNIERKMLKQQLDEAKIAADNSEKEYYEAEFGISFSDDV